MPENMDEKERPHSTAYLDGLRGTAALVVLSFHTLWAYCAFVEYGYGDGPENNHYLQLPIVRLVHAGHAMVPIFFVVGGYVMALKPLRSMRAHDCEDLHFSLARSVFRKAMRLYLSAIIATFISMLTIHLGLWDYPRSFITNKRVFNYPDKHPLPERSLSAELRRWTSATAGLTNILTYRNNGFVLPYYNPYDPHLWTIPFEVRATLVVAAVLLSTSRCRSTLRKLLTLAAILLSISLDRWECALFLSGALLADSPTLPLPIPLFLLPTALYLLSTPNLRIRHTPSHAFLIAFVPPSISDPKRFLHGLGAVFLLAALAACPPLQHPFVSSRFVRAAGRRSGALYVVHGPLLHVVGYSVTPALWRAVGWWPGAGEGEERWRWVVGFVGGSAVTWGVVWWVAGLFERFVERGCGRVARRVAEWAVGWLGEADGDGRLLPR